MGGYTPWREIDAVWDEVWDLYSGMYKEAGYEYHGQRMDVCNGRCSSGWFSAYGEEGWMVLIAF